jgi:phenylalanine-4-hydroxylase
MRQVYDDYSQQDQEVWQILFDRQQANLTDKACSAYLTCLTELAPVLNGNSIPRFTELDEALRAKTGWQIEVVPGLIPVGDFLNLLAQKRFCSSTWLRPKSQLDYLEEPDMFHDIFGHIPLLMNPAYADFMEAYGQLGDLADTDEKMELLKGFYWYTIEFGLLGSENETKIYGAGIISSFLETNGLYDPSTDIRPFEIDQILNTPFATDHVQTCYYLVPELQSMYDSLDRMRERIASTN